MVSKLKSDFDKILKNFLNENYSVVESMTNAILKEDENNIFCLKILGLTYTKTSKKHAALKVNEKVINLQPSDHEAYNNYALSLKDLNLIDDSIKAFRKSIELNPTYPDAYYNLSNVLEQKGSIDESIDLNRKAISLGSKNPYVFIRLSRKLYQIHLFDEAINILELYNKIDSKNTSIYSELVLCHEAKNERKKAIEAAKIGLSLNSKDPSLLHNYAIVLMQLGELDKAQELLTNSILLRPMGTSSHLALSGLKKYTHEDDHLNQMLNLLKSRDLPDNNLCQLAFAVAKAFEDMNDFEKSYHYYKYGNDLRKEAYNYTFDEDKNKYKLLTKNISIIASKKLRSYKILHKRPIFIVGMPRSGTTLVDQILTSHSKIINGGELRFIDEFGKDISQGIINCTSESLSQFRNKYLDKLYEISSVSESMTVDLPQFITDKAPLNFMHIPLISTALPEAKIILIKRNAAATIWGNYKQCFKSTNRSFGFTYSLKDLVKFYKSYTKYINELRNLSSIKFYTLDYERLVLNSENEIMKLFSYLELEYEEACLTPEKNPSPITTASVTQVREKIYTKSSSKWKAYKPFLNGLLDQFDV